MTPHIRAREGEIAETVLLPGDPLRAKWVAETFLSGAELVNDVRGMLGFTGTWNNMPVTVHGSGMGMPSLSIYANELISRYGARTVIRIGSCGAMREDVAIRDVVLAQAASIVATPSDGRMHGARVAPIADFGLLAAAHAAGRARGVGMHVGNIYSSDAFYDDRPDRDAALRAHGVLAVEMEAAELYLVAARLGARALAVLTVSDHLLTGEELPPEDRERSFGDMVEIALEAARAGAV